jgi:hypothetical protein
VAQVGGPVGWGAILAIVIVYAIIDDSSLPNHVLGEAVDVFVRRKDAERFIEEVRNDEPELAGALRIEERELDARGLNPDRASAG